MSLSHTPQTPGALEDEVPTPGLRNTVAINSDSDFLHMNQDEGAVNYSFPITTGGGPVVNCPCVLDTFCEDKCCVDTIRELRREKLAGVHNSFDPQSEESRSLSPYGSMDGISNGQLLRSPVASFDARGTWGWGGRGEEEEEEEEDSSTTPLIRAPRHLVSD